MLTKLVSIINRHKLHPRVISRDIEEILSSPLLIDAYIKPKHIEVVAEFLEDNWQAIVPFKTPNQEVFLSFSIKNKEVYYDIIKPTPPQVSSSTKITETPLTPTPTKTTTSTPSDALKDLKIALEKCQEKFTSKISYDLLICDPNTTKSNGNTPTILGYFEKDKFIFNRACFKASEVKHYWKSLRCSPTKTNGEYLEGHQSRVHCITTLKDATYMVLLVPNAPERLRRVHNIINDHNNVDIKSTTWHEENEVLKQLAAEGFGPKDYQSFLELYYELQSD